MYSIQTIAKIIKAEFICASHKQEKIEHLLIDSRKLHFSKNTLFFAIHGMRLDGHNYVNELYKKGVRNFVVDRNIPVFKLKESNVLLVENTVDALQKLTAHHRSQFSLPVVGITGSNGKTIVKEWLHQLLHKDYHIVRSPKSYNSQVGVPLSVWNIRENHNLALFEAGISQPGEMDKLAPVIHPDIGVFTNIGAAHSENFVHNQQKIREKLTLFRKACLIIYCKDHHDIDQSIVEAWHNREEKPDLLSWTLTGKPAQVFYEEIDAQIRCTYKDVSFEFEPPFNDKASLENLLHCITFLLHLEMPTDGIIARIKSLERIAMRLEQKKGVNGCVIINDSYNSDLDSLKIALDFLKQQESTRQHTVILSDILQSGLSGPDLYEQVSALVKQSEVHRFIGIGSALEKSQHFFAGDNLETTFYPDTNTFLQQANEDDFENEAILLKGARRFAFENIGSFLEEKTHSTSLEINLNALVHNLNFYNSLLKEGTKIMAMVKAFAYGAGGHEVAKLLEFHRADYLGVAYVDEGVALRKVGIKIPILVLNPEERAFSAMVRNNLEPEIYSFSLFGKFVRYVKSLGLEKPYPIHINVDTGMHRLGFEAQDIQKLIKKIKANNAVFVKSVFSHLVASDDASYDGFTRTQISTFEKLSNEIISALSYPVLKHICNTGGISRFPVAHFDMVRLGLGLYGVDEHNQEKLLPVGSLKSTISQIKDVKQGESIGYSRAGIAKQDMKIATISIGYGDGLSRKLSNGKGRMFVHGKPATIVGNVCMDMTMIDITNIEKVKEGDTVEVFGEHQSVTELAKQAETISYDIITGISGRVKRVYFED